MWKQTVLAIALEQGGFTLHLTIFYSLAVLSSLGKVAL